MERWLKFNFDEKVIPAVRKAAEGYAPAPKAIAAPIDPIVEYDEPDDAYPVPEFAGEPRQDDAISRIRARAASVGGKSEPDDPFGNFDDNVPF